MMRLAGLAERIAGLRGASIVVLPAKDIRARGGDGKSRRIGLAEEVVYARPTAARVVGDVVEIKDGELPDVVLQVDLGADDRRALSRYEKWGFPEVWVEVPDRRSKSRLEPRPGLAIHLLTRLGYVRSLASAAFPSWSADEIHAALNEPQGRMSEATAAALRRVGWLMRADAADDDPVERVESGAEATMDVRVEALDEIFRLRGFAASPAFAGRVASVEQPLATLLRAAYHSRDEDEFLERLEVVRETPLIV